MAADCEFFLYDPNDGQCLQESAASGDCAPGYRMESEYYMLYWNKKTVTVPEVTVSCANFGSDAVSCFENGCQMYNGQCSRECPDESVCVRLEDY